MVILETIFYPNCRWFWIFFNRKLRRKRSFYVGFFEQEFSILIPKWPLHKSLSFLERFNEVVEIRTNYKTGKDILQKFYWQVNYTKPILWGFSWLLKSFQIQISFLLGTLPSLFLIHIREYMRILTNCAYTILLQCPGIFQSPFVACSCCAALESRSGHHKICLVGILQRQKETQHPPVCTFNQPRFLNMHFPLPFCLTVPPVSYLAPLFKHIHVADLMSHQEQSDKKSATLRKKPVWYSVPVYCTHVLLTGAWACLISTVMNMSHWSNLATVTSSTSFYSTAFTHTNPQGWSSGPSTVSQGLMSLPQLPNNHPSLPRNQQHPQMVCFVRVWNYNTLE